MAHIRKKTTKAGKEFYEIMVHLSPEKQYTTRWYPPEGWSRRSIERELNREALRFELACRDGEVLTRRERTLQAEQEAKAAASRPTLRSYGETVFMPAKTVTMSENTRSSFQGMLDRRIYPALGDLYLEEITPLQITQYLLSLQTAGLAHATVVKHYTLLNLMFKMAFLADAIPRNPMDKVQRPKPRKDEVRQREISAYTAQELAYLLECLHREPLKWRTLITLMINTGIRRGECCALQWKYVDFAHNEITIAHNLIYTAKKGIILDTPKNGRQRTIPVAPSVMELLRHWRQEQSQSTISAFVFTQNDSPQVMHPQSPERYLRKLGARYGIPDLHPHKLRHSFASVAITSGADIASISGILGHSDKSVTLRMYTHADMASMSKAGNLFWEAIQKGAAANGT